MLALPSNLKIPVNIRIVVVLPAPLGPRIPTISPLLILKETLSTAIRSSNFFDRFKALIVYFYSLF